jgi:endoglucanase
MNFQSIDGVIKCNGSRFTIKGANWFGFETNVNVVHGLWARSINNILDWCVTNTFNAIRIPFSVEFALDLASKKPINPDGTSAINYSFNADLTGKLSSEILDILISKAADRGLLIMLDMHCLYPGGKITELWYDDVMTEDKVLQAWKNMVTRYNKWNVFAVDLKNEPHGAVTWGDGNLKTDIALFYERCSDMIQDINPNLLIFVEGIDRYKDDWGCWGSNLDYVKDRPIKLKLQNKLVYSPHQYGAGVCGTDSTSTKWQSRFGFIRDMKTNAVCVGEWGGDIVDYTWQNKFATWLASKDIDNFYWCINPNSWDTKGLLENDWKTKVGSKTKFCMTACPAPSKVTMSLTSMQVPKFP